jgi:hypothetical protein
MLKCAARRPAAAAAAQPHRAGHRAAVAPVNDGYTASNTAQRPVCKGRLKRVLLHRSNSWIHLTLLGVCVCVCVWWCYLFFFAAATSEL